MKKNITTRLLLIATLAAGNVAAQQAPSCPQLPVSANLQWDARVADGTAFCVAFRADGSEAFGLYISSEPGFKPTRSHQLESGSLNNQGVFWYRSEIAGNPDVNARETALELRDGVWVHVWLQTTSQEELDERLRIISQLRF